MFTCFQPFFSERGVCQCDLWIFFESFKISLLFFFVSPSCMTFLVGCLCVYDWHLTIFCVVGTYQYGAHCESFVLFLVYAFPALLFWQHPPTRSERRCGSLRIIRMGSGRAHRARVVQLLPLVVIILANRCAQKTQTALRANHIRAGTTHSCCKNLHVAAILRNHDVIINFSTDVQQKQKTHPNGTTVSNQQPTNHNQQSNPSTAMPRPPPQRSN